MAFLHNLSDMDTIDCEDSLLNGASGCSVISSGRQPYLFTLLYKALWPEALERVRTHPSDCHWVGSDGETALHATFSGCTCHVPLPILEALVKSNPQLVAMKMKDGCTALDSILLSWCDLIRSGQLVPPHEYRLRFQVIYKLVSFCPGEVISEKTLEYLFHFIRLWVDFRDTSDGMLRNHHHLSTNFRHTIGNRVSFIFALMDLVLYVYQNKRMRPMDDRPYFNFVNRLLEIRVKHNFPIFVLYLALARFGSNCCREYDTNGKTPLIHSILSDQFANDSELVTIIKRILQQVPGVASLPYIDGRYPLHLAIERGKRWGTGIEPLVFDSPQILCEKDSRSNLFPFMQASAEQAGLDTVYTLLLLNPLAIPSSQRPLK